MRHIKTGRLAIASIALVTGLLITPVGASTPTPKLPAMLLSISQMPTGWAVYSGSSNGLGCLANVLEPKGVKQTARATIEFEDNGSLPAVIERLVTFGNAKVGYQKIVSHLQGCKHLSGTTSGQKFSGTVGQTSFPRYGNASTAFEASLTFGPFAYEDLLIVRLGNIVMGIDEGDLAPIDTDQFQGFVEKALAKLPTASKVTTSTIAPAAESIQVTWCKLTIGESKSNVLAEMGPPHGHEMAAAAAAVAKAAGEAIPDYAEWDVGEEYIFVATFANGLAAKLQAYASTGAPNLPCPADRIQTVYAGTTTTLSQSEIFGGS